MKQAEMYPFQASDNVKMLYDKIATALDEVIHSISEKLNIEQSNIRISLDSLWDKSCRSSGLAVQIKAKNNEWEKPWNGNNFIIQTPNSEGVLINSSSFTNIDIKGFRNFELRAIYDNAHDLGLDKYVKDFIINLVNSLSLDELKLIAPNTPILVTGENPQ
jgi:hypothetical protein